MRWPPSGVNMKIGFDLQYKNHDVVYASMRLSESLEAMGYDTSFYSRSNTKKIYGLEWDSCITSYKETAYEDWLKTITHIIWPVPPTREAVQLVGKGIVTISLAPWDCLPSFAKKSLGLCAHVISPCEDNTSYLIRGAHLTNISTIKWDSHLPITKKLKGSVNLKNPRVLVPLQSSQGLRCDLDSMFRIISGVRDKCSGAIITILHDPKESMIWEVYKELRKFMNKQPLDGSISATACGKSPNSALIMYGNSDVVLWPAEIEGFGLVGIESLYMGTPVVAYDSPPASSIITHGVNGLLVPCNLGGLGGLTVFAEANVKDFVEISASAINHHLMKLNKKAGVGLTARRSKFNSSWRKVIEG